jgi:hypothetical protein
MTNKQDIRKAFDEINKAIIELENAKQGIISLHTTVKEVDDSIEVLNRISHLYEPSDDAHEAVFARVTQAKDKLREFDLEGRGKIKHALGVAYNATNEAYLKIK